MDLHGAENETRTRDPNLGKVVLYQLSYFRIGNNMVDFGFVNNFFDKNGNNLTNPGTNITK